MKTKSILILAAIALIALAIGFFIPLRGIPRSGIKAPNKIPQATGTANLSWSANTESDLAGYKIYYGTSPRASDTPPANYPNKIDVGKTDTPDQPTHIIKNLEIGKTYYFSITSYDTSNNESPFSQEISKIIK